jgi:hypothetical protein
MSQCPNSENKKTESARISIILAVFILRIIFYNTPYISGKFKQINAILGFSQLKYSIHKQRKSAFMPVSARVLNDVYFSACDLYCAVADCEKSEIPAHLDILACEEFRAALPDDNSAWLGDFACVQLDTTVFRIAVSTVSC